MTSARPQRTDAVGFAFCEVRRVLRTIDRKEDGGRQGPGRGGGGGGNRELVFNGGRVSVLRDRRVLETESGEWLCNSVNQSAPLDCRPTDGYSGKFYVMCIFPQ